MHRNLTRVANYSKHLPGRAPPCWTRRRTHGPQAETRRQRTRPRAHHEPGTMPRTYTHRILPRRNRGHHTNWTRWSHGYHRGWYPPRHGTDTPSWRRCTPVKTTSQPPWTLAGRQCLNPLSRGGKHRRPWRTSVSLRRLRRTLKLNGAGAG